ncbi:MAG: DUF192 domain-containing protein [Zoogloea sp.]|nr:DUF192 domain-containing protein [Zoogloea sp.]
MTRLRFLDTLTILGLVALPCAAQADMPQTELAAGMYRIEAEVASSFNQRAEGLMFRKTMPANHGMLFIFPATGRHCMWMRNTLLPLSVAFLDDEGRIVNVEDMQPQTENNHCAARPARYALEMNLGWFKQKRIKPGTAIGGLERLPLPTE